MTQMNDSNEWMNEWYQNQSNSIFTAFQMSFVNVTKMMVIRIIIKLQSEDFNELTSVKLCRKKSNNSSKLFPIITYNWCLRQQSGWMINEKIFILKKKTYENQSKAKPNLKWDERRKKYSCFSHGVITNYIVVAVGKDWMSQCCISCCSGLCVQKKRDMIFLQKLEHNFHMTSMLPDYRHKTQTKPTNTPFNCLQILILNRCKKEKKIYTNTYMKLHAFLPHLINVYSSLCKRYHVRSKNSEKNSKTKVFEEKNYTF